MGPITKARVNRLRDDFENLAQSFFFFLWSNLAHSFVKEIREECGKEEKSKLNGPNIKSGQFKTLIMVQEQ